MSDGDYGDVSFGGITRSGFVTVRSANGVGAQMSPQVDASQFVVDRMLGTNDFMPETPARPPMDYLSVKFDMSTHTPRLDLYEEADENQGATVAVELVFIPNDPQFNNGPAPVGDLGVLAPSIRDLSVNRTDDILTLYGLFGENPGPDREVTVDGVQLTVQSW